VDTGDKENEGLERWAQSDFDDASFTLCTINSVSKKTPNPKGDSETQTDPIVRVEGGAQTHWTSSVEDGSCKEVQTDTVEQVMTEATATQSEEESKLTMPEELPLDVTDFIHRVLPSVEDALQENLLSHAYSSLEIGWGDSSQFEAVVRHRLKDRNAEDQVAIEAAAVCQDVTAVSFNSSGNTLAVAYGDLKQQGWCDVQSCISVWRMHELHQKTEAEADQEKQEGLKPSTVLQLASSNFITCLAFHPVEPAILVSGSYSGEIIAWDVTADNEPMKFCSRVSDYSHREPVSSLSWVWDEKEKAYQLASAGTDGRILLWTLANKFDTPIIGFSIASVQRTNSINRDAIVHVRESGESVEYRLERIEGVEFPLPENKWRQHQSAQCSLVGPNDSRKECQLKQIVGSDDMTFRLGDNGFVVANVPKERVLGGTAMSFYPKNRSVVIVGCESGAVMRFNFVTHDQNTTIRKPTTPGAPVEWTHRAQALVDNVPAQLRQKMRVKIEDQAVTAKKDKITLQFILTSVCPEILQIFPSPVPFVYLPHQGPVLDLQYSPFHRNLFLSCSTDGSARLYNTLQPRPLLTFEAPCSSYLYAASWSPVRPAVFAMVSGAGMLYLFDLQHSQVAPALTLQVTEGESAISLTWTQNECICVGTASSEAVYIELNESFTVQRHGEDDLMCRLNEAQR